MAIQTNSKKTQINGRGTKSGFGDYGIQMPALARIYVAQLPAGYDAKAALKGVDQFPNVAKHHTVAKSGEDSVKMTVTFSGEGVLFKKIVYGENDIRLVLREIEKVLPYGEFDQNGTFHWGDQKRPMMVLSNGILTAGAYIDETAMADADHTLMVLAARLYGDEWAKVLASKADLFAKMQAKAYAVARPEGSKPVEFTEVGPTNLVNFKGTFWANVNSNLGVLEQREFTKNERKSVVAKGNASPWDDVELDEQAGDMSM